MNKYDYVTATIEEEKVRLEKIITYLKENSSNELLEYKERYNTVLKYLNSKEKYFNIKANIKKEKEKLEELKKYKDEYELDNILLEDTLLSNFHQDTEHIYRNIKYDDIKNQDPSIKNILYLVFEKQSSYVELVIKRNRLKSIIEKNKYPNTYNILTSQEIIIEKQNSIMDEIFLIENNIKVEEEKLKTIENDNMTTPILKLLYEFWIVDTYDKEKVNKNKLFEDNRTLVEIKEDISPLFVENSNAKEEDKIEIPLVEEKQDIVLPDLNLPGINEDTLVDIDGKNYIN